MEKLEVNLERMDRAAMRKGFSFYESLKISSQKIEDLCMLGSKITRTICMACRTGTLVECREEKEDSLKKGCHKE